MSYVRVDLTLWSTARDGVRFGHQSRQTPADGVTLGVRSAGGARPTRTRLAGVPHGAPYLRAGVGLQTFRTLAEGSPLLGDAHGVLTTRVGVTWVGHNAALLGSGVWHQPLGTLAGGAPFLWYTHGAGSAGVWITRVTRCGLVGRLRRVSSLRQAGVGAAIEAAEAPVGAVEVRHAHRPAGGELTSALVSSQGAGRGTHCGLSTAAVTARSFIDKIMFNIVNIIFNIDILYLNIDRLKLIYKQLIFFISCQILNVKILKENKEPYMYTVVPVQCTPLYS